MPERARPSDQFYSEKSLYVDLDIVDLLLQDRFCAKSRKFDEVGNNPLHN